MTPLRLSLFLLPLLFVNGCASLFSDSTDPIRIESVPSGAQVVHEGRVLGVTPFTANVPRTSDTSYLTFKMAGYKTKNVMLDRGLAPASLLNLVFVLTTFGVTSWGIDYSSGKMFKYSSRSYAVELERPGHASLGDPGPLGFVIDNERELRNELARGQSERWKDLCRQSLFDDAGCTKFLDSVRARRDHLLAQGDGLELYRALILQ